jgi:hypothetical protein
MKLLKGKAKAVYAAPPQSFEPVQQNKPGKVAAVAAPPPSDAQWKEQLESLQKLAEIFASIYLEMTPSQRADYASSTSVAA